MDTTWLENLLNAGANAYSTVKTADALSHQQVSPNGQVYTNGQFGTTASPVGISPVVLLVGAAAFLYVALKD